MFAPSGKKNHPVLIIRQIILHKLREYPMDTSRLHEIILIFLPYALLQLYGLGFHFFSLFSRHCSFLSNPYEQIIQARISFVDLSTFTPHKKIKKKDGVIKQTLHAQLSICDFTLEKGTLKGRIISLEFPHVLSSSQS